MFTLLLPLLVEPQTLLPLLGHKDLLIIDVCHPDNYRQHHIPGAIHIHPGSLQCGTPPAPGKLPSIEQLTAMFAEIGLSDEKHVLVYDDEGGGWAGRLIWTLDVIGHTQSSYLNGGLHSWASEQLPLENTINKGQTNDFTITAFNEAVIAEIEDIVPNLNDDNFAIWDARSAAEYRGERQIAQRSGHIPGAVNIDWLELMDRDKQLRFIDLEVLQERLNNLGLSADKTIVTHCQSHHRSGLSYLLMKILGYPNIKAYHGSWGEWGNREDTPIEC